MAASTAISGQAPGHRTARIGGVNATAPFALDWNNAQTIVTTSTSAVVQSAVFDAENDRIVVVSGFEGTTTSGALLTVNLSANLPATASVTTVGFLAFAASQVPFAVYVPAGMVIGAVSPANANTYVQMIPALIASTP